jgi:hypothetical protein
MRLTDLYNDEIAALYRQGLSDAEIGRELGITRQLIRDWRLRQGLPPNKAAQGKHIPAKEEFGDEWQTEKARMREAITGWR